MPEPVEGQKWEAGLVLRQDSPGRRRSHPTETGQEELTLRWAARLSSQPGWTRERLAEDSVFALSGKVLTKHLDISGCTSCHEENPLS